MKAEPAAKSLPGIAIVAPEDARRAEIPQIAEADDSQAEPARAATPETIIAALPPRSIPLPGFAPRPKVDVGVTTAEAAPANPVPETVPFAVAAASSVDPAATAAPSVADNPVQVAVTNIPLPSWRPEIASAESEPAKQDAVLMALAHTGERGNAASAVLAVLPSARPEPVKVAAADPVDVKDDEVKAVVDQVSAGEYQVASLSTVPTPRSAFSDPSGIDAASPRFAVTTRPTGSDPAAAIGAGVKTTRKEARASLRDIKPEPKAVVVAAAPGAAGWVLRSGDYVAAVADSPMAPRFAYNLVRTAPSEVYTNGFQPENQMEVANRFTGSAVKFLSVARFQTK